MLFVKKEKKSQNSTQTQKIFLYFTENVLRLIEYVFEISCFSIIGQINWDELILMAYQHIWGYFMLKD